MTKRQQRRNKGEGSITQLPNGKYKCTITIGKGLDGKQKRKSVTAKTKTELFNKVAALKTQYNLMTQEEQQAHMQNITYQEFSERVKKLQEGDLAYSTQQQYNSIDKKYLYPSLGALKMNQITSNTCEEFIEGLKINHSLANASLKLIKRRLSKIFNLAVKKNIISSNPLHKATLIIPEDKVKAAFTLPTVDKVEKLLQYMKDTHNYLYPFVLASVLTGMRRSELMGLKWSCVNFNNNTIKIDNQISVEGIDAPLKTPSSYRTIHISLKLVEVLKELKKHSHCAYVFETEKSHTHMYHSIIHRIMRPLFQRFHFPDSFTFHDFRHFHATQLIRHNINVKVVSRRLGHKDIITTLNLYFNYIPSMDEEASKTLDFLKGI